ncbi:transferase family-domain-containing protein [Chaetomidium leptoderma]|uniref:Transferase family-domain-containing protein n=1 Tax=Chaetomidium leptoderma TaxID=669021 RepID=A0AAN6ZUT4_9PEZI|nr:transferase family-domain-containing protein [Chaetomidium leptoderma]
MDHNMNKAVWVAGLSETMPLTPLDYTAPQNYIMRSFGFPFPSNLETERLAAVTYLKARLARAFSLLPFLAGQIIHAREGELPRLVYPGEGYPSNLDSFPDEVFDHQVLESALFPWTFEQLSALGVPAASMTKHLLWLLPKTDLAPGDTCHPVTLRVTFIDGGLILGFSLHHGVMDGTGTVDFLNYFASDTLDGLDNLQHRKTNLRNFADNIASTTPIDVHSLAGYDFTTTPPPTPLPPAAAIAKILSISSQRATALHAATLAQIRATHGPQAFVSQTDTLCALVWVHVTRARLHAGHIRPHDTTRFTTAVDIRRRCCKGLFPDHGYIGNLFVRVLASATVNDLVGGGDLATLASTAQIAGAAWLIREAIRGLLDDEDDDDSTLRSHLAVAARAARGGEEVGLTCAGVDAAVRRAIARHSTGLDASVGVGLGADVVWDIPGVPGGGKASWVRRAYVANDGAMNVLPRRGGTKGGENWEVWLALREEDMTTLEGQGELGGYLCRPPA